MTPHPVPLFITRAPYVTRSALMTPAALDLMRQPSSMIPALAEAMIATHGQAAAAKVARALVDEVEKKR